MLRADPFKLGSSTAPEIGNDWGEAGTWERRFGAPFRLCDLREEQPASQVPQDVGEHHHIGFFPARQKPMHLECLQHENPVSVSPQVSRARYWLEMLIEPRLAKIMSGTCQPNLFSHSSKNSFPHLSIDSLIPFEAAHEVSFHSMHWLSWLLPQRSTATADCRSETSLESA